MEEYKVGEEFQFGRIKLRVEPCIFENSCKGCFFELFCDNDCKRIETATGRCDKRREDKESVIFVKVEEDEKP